jgi:hypothetical protein
MKHCSLFVLGLVGAAVASAQHQGKSSEGEARDLIAPYIASYTKDKWLVILDAEHEFYSAKREAERISKLSSLPFSMEGLEFDRRRGLALPDKGDDAPDAGRYIARRYNGDAENPQGYISIERSDGYPGLTEGFYVVVGAICNSSREANAKLHHFQPFAPTAYVAKTQIYMGCIH